MAMNTFDALIALHEAERRIFGRLIDMGADTKMTKKIMALLMWLESEGGLKGLVKKISSQTDKVMAVVGTEAETALGFLESNALSPGASSISMPVTLDLAKPVPDSFSLNNLFEDKERASNGISQLVNGVCEMIFKDILEDRCKEGNVSVAMADIVRKLVVAEGKKPGGPEGGKKSAVVASSGSKLNPYAQEWRASPEEERCLYVTFSNGYPLSENQIFWFFTRRYGDCVERIYLHKPMDGPALFGKIVFKKRTIPALVLNGRHQVRFYINDRPMWVKKYRSPTLTITTNNTRNA